jgi:nicotinic acid mononucleotide adenylyltransferase
MSIHSLLEKKIRTFIYSTGAGAGAQKTLWDIPGCSSFLVGCGFPYETKLTSKIIGYTPKQFSSMETAAELAMAAYMEAYDPDAEHVDTIGIGLSGSVASTVEHRGDHRLNIVAINNKQVYTSYIKLPKGAAPVQRKQDGGVADMLILETLNGMSDPEKINTFKWMYSGSSYTTEIVQDFDSNIVKDLLLERPYFKADGTKHSKDYFMLHSVAEDFADWVFYPGTFNPFHLGHESGAKSSFKTAVGLNSNVIDVVFSTCINPKHKSEPTVQETLQRIKQMRNKNYLLTRDDPYYIDKSNMFPGAMFAIGADVLLSMFDPKWGLDSKAMLDFFLKNNTKFLVQGRLIGDKFTTLNSSRFNIDLLREFKYNNIFIDVPGRNDISSTELRSAK